jgi:4-hydroxybenzoate polyprenyltransferase
MFSRSSLLHLRIPFSYFLLPVFFFSLSISANFNGPRMFWVFFIVHFLLYPASNGYNSYFDKDEKSIGGLRTPPPTEPGLYYLALTLDLVAIILGYLKINATFAVMLVIYGLISKAYSHPLTRLKKYGISSLFLTGVFQGFFTFCMCYIGINNYTVENCLRANVVIPAVLTSLMLMANYPMTQVYQHEEDQKRGDVTLSIKLGLKGTFYFAAIVFAIALVGFFLYFRFFYNSSYSWTFLLSVSPVLIYFFYWLGIVLKDERFADYSHTMWLNAISATCLSGFFIFLFLKSTQLLQLFQ